jgi:hypothetical protein
MDQRPLVSEQIDAGSEFLNRLDKAVPIKAAFWLKTYVDGKWRLFVVSDEINDSNVYEHYGEVNRVMRDMRDPDIDQFRVKLVGTNDPLARAVLDYQALYPGKRIRRYDTHLGGVGVEEIYIYPSPLPTPAQQDAP